MRKPPGCDLRSITPLVLTMALAAGCASEAATPEAAAPPPVAVDGPPSPELPGSVGEMKVVGVACDDAAGVTRIVIEISAPTIQIFGLGMTRDVVEATVDGRVVELGEVDFAMYGDAVGGFDHPGFRFAVWWRGRLPQGARSITLRGRVPLRVGVGGRLEEFPCATGPAGMRFEAAHNRWKIGEVQPLPSGRRVALDLDGAGGHVAVGFMDSTGRPIPTGQFTGSGGGIGGRSWSSGRVWVAPEPQIAAVRITSFERAETRSFPIDVTGQVVPGVLSPSLASERE